jgi:hypothetical protein
MLRISLALALALASTLAACHHDAATAPPSNRRAPSAPAAAIADPLGFLPVDSDVVIGIDVRGLRASALWAEYQPQLARAIGPQLGEVQRSCGFDPLQAIDSITVGGASKSSEAVIVVRGLDRDRTVACLERNLIPDTKVTSDHGMLLLANQSGRRNLVTFADRTTLVLQGSTAPTPESLRAVLQSGVPLRGSPGFVATFERLEPGATLWMVINGKAAFFDKFADAAIRPVAIFATLRLGDGFAAKAHMRLATPEAAAQATALAQAQIAQAAAMFDRLEVAADADVMTVTAEMKLDKVRTLIAMLVNLVGAAATSP